MVQLLFESNLFSLVSIFSEIIINKFRQNHKNDVI